MFMGWKNRCNLKLIYRVNNSQSRSHEGFLGGNFGRNRQANSNIYLETQRT